MTTLKDMIEAIKLETPTLKTGNDEDGYKELTEEEYTLIISQWAEARLEQQGKLKKEAEAVLAKEIATAKLEALGLTADDLKALGL